MSTRRRKGRALDSWVQLVVSFVGGAAVGVLVAFLVAPSLWALFAWDAVVAVYLAWVWLVSWPCDADQTRERAAREDPSRRTVTTFLVVAAAVSFWAATLALLGSSSESTGTRGLTIGLGIASVVLSWLLVNTVFMLEYARRYYDDVPGGGLDFNQEDPPRYSDFAYISFSVGMTFTVPDVTVRDGGIRRAVLGHALLSFLFASGLIAIVISLVPSLAP